MHIPKNDKYKKREDGRHEQKKSFSGDEGNESKRGPV
jgi:hypothetical protein